MYQEFKHQQALTIGGSSGIGRAVAKILLAQGSTVTIVGRNADKLQATASELQQTCNIQVWQADISDHQDTSRLIERIARELPNLRYLVDSAGVFQSKSFLDHSEAEYDRYLNINYGTFFDHTAGCSQYGSAETGWRNCQYWFYVGISGCTRYPLVGLLNGKSRFARAHATLSYGTCSKPSSCQCGCSRSRRNSNL